MPSLRTNWLPLVPAGAGASTVAVAPDGTVVPAATPEDARRPRQATALPAHVAPLVAAALLGAAPSSALRLRRPRGAVNPLLGVPARARRGPLTAAERARLLAVATQRPDLAWRPTRSIAAARNAHLTNTYAQLLAALQGNFDYLESDIRIDKRGTVVTAHDKDQPDALALEEWLDVAVPSGRGLKFDVKEAHAIERVVQALQRRGVPGWRVILNVTVLGKDAASLATAQQLRLCRQAFPDAIINLSFSDEEFTPSVLAKVVAIARTVPGPLMFPLRGDRVNSRVVATLRPYGRIAIWNSPLAWSPRDVPAEVARFRAMGVDGMIDLRTI